MRLHSGFDVLDPAHFVRPAVTIGVFDGIHLGHRVVLETTRDLARRLNGESVVVTFEIHPRLIVHGEAPPMLTSLPHKLVLLERAGIDHTVVLPFTEEVRNIAATEFADRVFLHGIGARGIVIGYDSHFGRDREGGLDFLTAWAEDKDVVVESAPPVLMHGRAMSSSVIREAIVKGEYDLAQSMLGRPVAVYGIVREGSGRGREIGFSTANLDMGCELTPPSGVYAAWSRLRGIWRPALVNIGTRPTFESGSDEIHVEVHIPGIDEELYGEELEVQFIRRMRDERRFDGVEALREQIGKDRDELDRIIAEVQSPPPPPSSP